jgi:hypothetical protein
LVRVLLFDSDWTDSDENMFVMVVTPVASLAMPIAVVRDLLTDPFPPQQFLILGTPAQAAGNQRETALVKHGEGVIRTLGTLLRYNALAKRIINPEVAYY